MKQDTLIETSSNEIALFLQELPHFLFFTGKGGVGKTSLSCATALLLADQGKKTLLVSTDPASNLDQVLGVKLTSQPTPIPGNDNLWAMNIDPRQSAAEYRERVVKPFRGVLPDAAINEIEEKLSGSCTVEIAAFDEFSKLMTDIETLSKFRHVIFDTAPTGHTLRLLQLPAAWNSYLETNSGDASCLGPLTGLKGQKEQFEDTLEALTDKALTRLILVARPDMGSISEAHRTSVELAKLGVENQFLAINGVLETVDEEDATARAMKKRQKKALDSIPLELQKLPRVYIPLSPAVLIGIPALRSMFKTGDSLPLNPSDDAATKTTNGTWDLMDLIDSINVKTGVIMVMGKGGVGKTTLASRIAVEMSTRGAKVHLTTSDPAAHLNFSLSKQYPNLQVSRIDPLVETELYRQEVLQETGSKLDEDGRRLLEEDLHSPCTEETAVFRAFARVVGEATDTVVVIDTAPTGHTILLLDATEAYHREVSRNSSNVPEEVKTLLPRLRDPNYTRIMIVTLPEATPVQEAADLQKDLERAGIKPYAWIVNQSLTPLTVHHPVLRIKRANEYQHISRVQDIAKQTVIVPWQDTDEYE